MDIASFVDTLAGKWFSQRTTHYLANQTSKAGQSNLLIEVLPATDANLVELCTAQGQEAAQILCGLKIDQDSRMDGDTRNTQGTTLMVMLQPQDGGQGLLLQASPKQPVAQGHYGFDENVLTLTTHTPEGTVEERLWFANPNLRMRTSVFKVGDQEQMASFCSEIRMGGAPAKS
ncbi:MAG: phycobiliprotein lyase [Leptolyngbya sp.]|nr:phycobiliprotein lyase [Leptolyngbya sp.]